MNVQEEIKQLAKQRKAVILAHNYQRAEVQDIADYVGDSLGLSQQAAETDAEVIIFCGVHFMAETAYILSPDKTVVLPDAKAGCPLADMITVEALKERKKQLKDYTVVTYINSSASVKAESDICCTSSNAVKVIEKIASDKILFVPDKNLALWSKAQTGKEVVIWPGFCPTHHYIKAEQVKELKEKYPNAEFMAHPECTPEVVALADFVGSTSAMFKYASSSKAKHIIVGSEASMLHRLQKENPDKVFIIASKQAVCPNMKKTTLAKIKEALVNLAPVITVEEDVRQKALTSVERMLEVV
jgi:quinolinate synthase